jgi:hypothetical protein
MNQKRRKPIAVCTDCGVYIYDAQLINIHCREVRKGKRCEGCYGSALAPGDWKECPTCLNTGKMGADSCGACQGSGWIYVREEFWNPLKEESD